MNIAVSLKIWSHCASDMINKSEVSGVAQIQAKEHNEQSNNWNYSIISIILYSNANPLAFDYIVLRGKSLTFKCNNSILRQTNGEKQLSPVALKAEYTSTEQGNFIGKTPSIKPTEPRWPASMLANGVFKFQPHKITIYMC